MGYEVRLTAKARGDLNEIVTYIAQDNPKIPRYDPLLAAGH
jgi:plasmid stabilization system protein ParE